jgi:hypothetical protein
VSHFNSGSSRFSWTFLMAYSKVKLKNAAHTSLLTELYAFLKSIKSWCAIPLYCSFVISILTHAECLVSSLFILSESTLMIPSNCAMYGIYLYLYLYICNCLQWYSSINTTVSFIALLINK